MLTLYRTDHCTLCDQAMDLLLSTPEVAGMSLQSVEIALDDQLVARYGERIPVLATASAEIVWPFDADAIRALVSAARAN